MARVENGGRQFLSLRFKDSSLIAIFQRRRGRRTGRYRALIKISASILDNTKKDINKTSRDPSFLDFSFLFFFFWLRGRRSESKERTMSREESCDLLNKRFFSIESWLITCRSMCLMQCRSGITRVTLRDILLRESSDFLNGFVCRLDVDFFTRRSDVEWRINF